ncbi:MAG TPA: aminoacyl-tRNA hydrolase [Thermodesulfovibrionia bacterium]|nr:aminoacyl-tRNA hydrolase [Thermodesulfovibrionia bacterium]
MWIIVGLGNPGKIYSRTRHNLGFMVVDRVAELLSFPPWKNKNACELTTHTESGLMLVKPMTYMNRSGQAVAEIVRYNRVTELVVVHDDLDLSAGAIKIRQKGSSGGHKGVASIIEYLKKQDFIRIKIGIGRPAGSVEEYVLSPFNKDEIPVINESIQKASEAVCLLWREGLEKAQNLYNLK